MPILLFLPLFVKILFCTKWSLIVFLLLDIEFAFLLYINKKNHRSEKHNFSLWAIALIRYEVIFDVTGKTFVNGDQSVLAQLKNK